MTAEPVPEPAASTSDRDDGLGPGIDHPHEALAAVAATRQLIAALRIWRRDQEEHEARRAHAAETEHSP